MFLIGAFWDESFNLFGYVCLSGALFDPSWGHVKAHLGPILLPLGTSLGSFWASFGLLRAFVNFFATTPAVLGDPVLH